MSKPHKHAKLIKAWADGAEIEVKVGENNWVICEAPSWFKYSVYRIKPEPKPDLVLYGHDDWLKAHGRKTAYPDDTIKLVFDGESGKLKSAEVLK